MLSALAPSGLLQLGAARKAVPGVLPLAPNQVTGFNFWLRADTGLYQDTAGTTPAGIGDPVGRWTDQGPNALHVTQATAGKRPTRATTIYKGEPGVRFLASSQQQLTNPVFQLTSAKSAWTWLAMFKGNITGTQDIVSPMSHVLGLQNDNGNLIWTHHGGAVEYGSFAHPSVGAGQLVICTFDASGSGNAGKLYMRINKLLRALVYSQTIVATAYTTSATVQIGNHWTGSAYFNSDLLELASWARVLTAEEIDGLEEYVRQRYFGLTTGNVHWVGDSLVKGYPDNTGNGLDPVTKLGVKLGGSWTCVNHGIVAFTIGQLENTAETTTTPDRNEWRDRVNGGLGDIVIHQGGTNNLYPATNNQEAATAIAEMVTSVTKRHNRGLKVLVCTVPPMGPQADLSPAQEATFETRRLAYNTSVRNGDTGADGIVDWAADSRFSDPTNATYFYSGDQLHFTAAGNDAAADIAKAAVLALS